MTSPSTSTGDISVRSSLSRPRSPSSPPAVDVPIPQSGSTELPSRKSRKINRVLPQLKRNAACVPCRRRRIKCDAAKPTCSSCVRHFHFLGRTQPDEERDRKGIECFYDTEDEGDGTPGAVAGIKRGGEHGREDWEERDDEEKSSLDTVRVLEARIAQLESQLEVAAVESQQMLNNHTSSYRLPNQQVVTQLPSIRASTPSRSTIPQSKTPVGAAPYAHSSLRLPHGMPDLAGNAHWDPARAHPSMPAGMHPGGDEVGPVGVIDYQSGRSSYPSSAHSIPLATVHLPTFEHPAFVGKVSDPSSPRKGAGPHPTVVSAEQGTNYDAESSKVGDPMLQVFWPGWSKNLPTPAMVDHLVHTFFSMVPSVSRLIHRQSFFSRLTLPPTHPDFPHVSLLHAICAVAARFSAAVKCDSVEESLDRRNDGSARQKSQQHMTTEEQIASEPCFGERNAKYAVLEMKYEGAGERHVFEILQAQVVIVTYYQQSAKFVDAWHMVGRASRAAIPLGMMQDPDLSGSVSEIRRSILSVPLEDWQREERRLLICFILINEIGISSSVLWPGSISMEDLTATLPAALADFERGYAVPDNPQTHQSRDFYTHHPVEDSFVMHVKAMTLLGYITRLLRRLKSVKEGERSHLSDSPQFQAGDAMCRSLIGTIPASLRDPLRPLPSSINRIDSDLVNAHIVPQIATIFLHEPFADLTDPTCVHARKLLGGARAILSILNIVINSSTDLTYMLTPLTSLWLFTAARTILLFYHRALETGDKRLAQALLSDIEVFQMAFTAQGSRYCIGASHSGLLDSMVRRINKEFNVPPKVWRWSTSDWMAKGAVVLPDGTMVSRGSIPMADSRINPTGQTPLLLSVTATHPDGLTWASAHTEGMRYRDIVDQTRNFVRLSKTPDSDRPLPDLPMPDQSFAVFHPIPGVSDFGSFPVGHHDGQASGAEMQEWLDQLGAWEPTSMEQELAWLDWDSGASLGPVGEEVRASVPGYLQQGSAAAFAKTAFEGR